MGQQPPPPSTIPMPPASWQDDVGYMSAEPSPAINSPLNSSNPWMRAVETLPKHIAATSVAAPWNMWNPVPFPSWQFNLTSSSRSPAHQNCMSFNNTSSPLTHLPQHRTQHRTKKSPIFIHDSPSSPQSIITISSSSDEDEDPFEHCDMNTSHMNTSAMNTSIMNVSNTEHVSCKVEKKPPTINQYAYSSLAETPSPLRMDNSHSSGARCGVIQHSAVSLIHPKRSSSTQQDQCSHLAVGGPVNLCYMPTNVTISKEERIICKQEPSPYQTPIFHTDSSHDFMRPLPLVSTQPAFSAAACAVVTTAALTSASGPVQILPPCFISPIESFRQTQLIYPQVTPNRTSPTTQAPHPAHLAVANRSHDICPYSNFVIPPAATAVHMSNVGHSCGHCHVEPMQAIAPGIASGSPFTSVQLSPHRLHVSPHRLHVPYRGASIHRPAFPTSALHSSDPHSGLMSYTYLSR